MVSPNLGQLGEQLTAQWLKEQGWEILASRWRCRWGELDLVAYHPSPPNSQETSLIFVEVKTRRIKNWDADGLLAINPQKQEKLHRAAEMFLGTYPDYSEVNCRFDLALVQARLNQRITSSQGRSLSQKNQNTLEKFPSVIINSPVFHQGYELTLKWYLKDIF